MKYNTLKSGLLFGGMVLFAIGSYGQSSDEKRKSHEPPSIEEVFKMLDADEDGKLSKKEVKGSLKKDFAKIDTDEDGFITKKELEKAPKPKRHGPKGKQ